MIALLSGDKQEWITNYSNWNTISREGHSLRGGKTSARYSHSMVLGGFELMS